ncbi:Tropinesterase [Burkholderiales bacterium]|nr:Tropinesterase [Burkholderiales bacterium]
MAAPVLAAGSNRMPSVSRPMAITAWAGKTDARSVGANRPVVVSADLVYLPRRVSRSQFLEVRGLRYHVRLWGETGAPKVFLLHGWMDVSASFQFLVDALSRDWQLIAPDWRGFGLSAWAREGYWFADYLADLEVLLDHFAPGERVDLVGHSMGGNVACLYAGVRPERMRRVASLEGFGTPEGDPARAPQKFADWLDALQAPPEFKPYPNLAAVADRLQKSNPRLPRERALFLAGHWAHEGADGARLRSDPRHKAPFPSVYRLAEMFACWRRIVAPVLWVDAPESFVPQWLADGAEGFARRKAQIPHLRHETIDAAGHMLHLDQPERVAAVVEDFLLRDA